MRVGFDTSSLNRFAADSGRAAVLDAVRNRALQPILSAITVLELAQWSDIAKRDAVMEQIAELRAAGDFLLLPLPHEVLEAEFDAWLHNRPNMILGDEPTAYGLLQVLCYPDLREDSLAADATAYTDSIQQSHLTRLRSVLDTTQRLHPSAKPPTLDALLHGLLHQRDALAGVLNAWFAPLLKGRAPITPAEAVQLVERLPILRAFFVTIGAAGFAHGVQRVSLRRNAPGAVDIQQAAYLPLVDVFVVDDAPMRVRLEQVARVANLRTKLIGYADLAASCRDATTP